MGRGSRRPPGLRGPASPACSAPPLCSHQYLVCSSRPSVSAFCSRVTHLSVGEPEKSEAPSGGGLWASQDPSRKKQFIPPVFASSGLPDPFGLPGPSSKAQELLRCLQTNSGQIQVQIPAPHALGEPQSPKSSSSVKRDFPPTPRVLIK